MHSFSSAAFAIFLIQVLSLTFPHPTLLLPRGISDHIVQPLPTARPDLLRGIRKRDDAVTCGILTGYSNAIAPVCSGSRPICSFTEDSDGHRHSGCCDESGDCEIYTTCIGADSNQSCDSGDRQCLSCTGSAIYPSKYNWYLTNIGLYDAFSCGTMSIPLDTTLSGWVGSIVGGTTFTGVGAGVITAVESTTSSTVSASTTTTSASAEASTASSESSRSLLTSSKRPTPTTNSPSSTDLFPQTKTTLSTSPSTSASIVPPVSHTSAPPTSSSSAPTSSSSSSSSTGKGSESSTIHHSLSIGEIVGIAIGAAIVIIIIGLAIWWFIRRRRSDDDDSSSYNGGRRELAAPMRRRSSSM